METKKYSSWREEKESEGKKGGGTKSEADSKRDVYGVSRRAAGGERERERLSEDSCHSGGALSRFHVNLTQRVMSVCLLTKSGSLLSRAEDSSEVSLRTCVHASNGP